VRLLARLRQDGREVGRFHPPSTELVRFSAYNTVSFPASEIQALTTREDGPPLLSVNFMGLTGATGVLPLYYTELVMDRLRAKDSGLRDFLDIFNHRAISLFYQAWEKYRFPVAYERARAGRFLDLLLAVVGLGLPALCNRQAVGDESLAFYGGLLAQEPRSASALERILGGYFEVPVEVEQFAGAWCTLDQDTQTRFLEVDDFSTELGGGAVVGDEVWDLQSRARIKLGPMPLGRYLEFLPAGSAHAPLRAITRFFSGDELDFEVQLILQRDDVPACVLGAEGETAPRLGWATWVKSVPINRDPSDTVLYLQRD
jgi:type VI secretion system protein ImpH